MHWKLKAHLKASALLGGGILWAVLCMLLGDPWDIVLLLAPFGLGALVGLYASLYDMFT